MISFDLVVQCFLYSIFCVSRIMIVFVFDWSLLWTFISLVLACGRCFSLKGSYLWCDKEFSLRVAAVYLLFILEACTSSLHRHWDAIWQELWAEPCRSPRIYACKRRHNLSFALYLSLLIISLVRQRELLQAPPASYFRHIRVSSGTSCKLSLVLFHLYGIVVVMALK